MCFASVFRGVDTPVILFKGSTRYYAAGSLKVEKIIAAELNLDGNKEKIVHAQLLGCARVSVCISLLALS